MAKRIIGILICVAALAFAAPLWAGQTYVNGIDANFPPFAYVDKDGKPQGFDVDVMDLIAKDKGFTVKHQPMDWDGIVASLVAKKIDMVASGMSITEERKQKVSFTNPYWTIKQVMVAKKDSKATVDEIKGQKKTLGVQKGTSEAKWIQEQISKGAFKCELRFYDSAPMAIEDVLNGRIDAAAMDDAPAMDASLKKPVKLLGTFGMPDESFGYAVRKEDTKLLQDLNDGLKKIMASPKWAELVKKHKLGESN